MKPCNVKHNGEWYHVNADGFVTVGKNGTEAVDATLTNAVRQTVQHLRRKKRARLNYRARRDIGLVRTPYGWE